MFSTCMNVKTKTAGIAVLLNSAFTLLKFIIYPLTGSLAVLADAWHSLSDIATSLLLFYSFVQNKPSSSQAPSTEGKAATHAANEVVFSFLIGIVLLAAAGLIYHKGSLFLPYGLIHTVPAGIFFIFFAFCSYALSRFETRIGQAEYSIGLLADAAHSKADMLAALLTGLSLILHAVGLNLDRLVAYIIATLILCTGIETLINTTFAILQKDSSLVRRHKLQHWLLLSLQPSTWSALSKRLSSRSDAGRFIGLILKQSIQWTACIAAFLLLTPLITSSYYLLEPSQEAIVKRLGVPRQTAKPVGPGLHFKLPRPIDQVIIVDTRSLHTVRVGPVTPAAAGPLLWTRQHGAEEPFLSADNSFFYPYASVNYTITNLHAYLFNQQAPEVLLQQAASQIMTRESLGCTFYELATRQRAALETRIAEQLQARLDGLNCGIQVCDVFLRDVHPPIPIAPAFENVIAAFQEKQQMINEAYGYQNDSIPEARGDAERQVTEAHAYANRTGGEAVGRMGRRLQQLEAWQQAPVILRKNHFLQTLKNALSARALVLIDPAAGSPDLWMTESGLSGFPGFTRLPAPPESDLQMAGPEGELNISYDEEEE
jgi:membrane protease subunit HflK